MRRLILIAALAAVLVLPESAAADEVDPGLLCMDGRLSDLTEGSVVAEPSYSAQDTSPVQRAEQNGSFIVTYKGAFPEDAKTAFQYALDTWSRYLDVTVPIRVEANWKVLGAGKLGTAGPTKLLSGFPGAPSGHWYPIALANQIAGTDLDAKSVDITSNFASTQKSFYFGTDGRTPRGKFDFVSVVMHEIGHGLGLTGTADVVGTNGTIGSPPKYTASAIYDVFVVNSNAKPLFGGFKTKTPELKQALTSGGLFWYGANGVAATPGTAPRLFAPTTWSDSSVYHLDEETFAAGSADSLMSPMLDDEESQHRVGPVIRGILSDIGWTLAPVAPAYLYFLDVPAGTQPGELLLTQPKVAVLNGRGYTVAEDNETVITLSLVGTGGDAALSCDGGFVKTAKEGLAKYTGCRIEGTGIGLRVVAWAEGLTSAESPPFVVIRRGNFRGLTAGVSRDE